MVSHYPQAKIDDFFIAERTLNYTKEYYAFVAELEATIAQQRAFTNISRQPCRISNLRSDGRRMAFTITTPYENKEIATIYMWASAKAQRKVEAVLKEERAFRAKLL
jgi:hypothetical protein